MTDNREDRMKDPDEARWLAIVGSRKFRPNTTATMVAESIIVLALKHMKPDRVVSGGAVGIDRLAIQLAKEYNYPTKEFLPIQKNWPSYRTRDMQIAVACDILICITHADSKTHGARWTADYARRLGRTVVEYVISEDGNVHIVGLLAALEAEVAHD